MLGILAVLFDALISFRQRWRKKRNFVVELNFRCTSSFKLVLMIQMLSETQMS